MCPFDNRKALKIKDPSSQEAIFNAIERNDFAFHKRNETYTGDHESSVSDLLEDKLQQRIFHVHRLDMETSGVCLYAKTDIACAELCRQFRDREVAKTYLARVVGHVAPHVRRVTIPMRPDLENRPLQVLLLLLSSSVAYLLFLYFIFPFPL